MMKASVFLGLIATHAVAETGLLDQRENYVCHRTLGEITVDGAGDEMSWKKAPWTAEFVDIEGDKKPKPLHQTRVKMLWDDAYFYFYAEMVEPHIWATYDKRDSVIFHENDFEVFIDPDGDTHAYYELEINALETVWDLMLLRPYRDDGKAIDSWDIIGLKKAVKLNGTLNDPSDVDKGWSVELAIPWQVLEEAASPSKRPQPGDQWRVNFSRVQWQLDVQEGRYVKKLNPKTGKHFPEFNWVWSPQGVIAMHQPESWGIVQFSGMKAGEKDRFVHKREDVLRDTLRRVYYAQARHKKKQGKYAQSLKELGGDYGLSDAFDKQWGAGLSIISDGFGYRVQYVEQGYKAVINEFGRVRVKKHDR